MSNTFASTTRGLGAGTFAEPPAEERLFFALFPDPAGAAALAALGATLRRRHGLAGVPAPAPKLHVTLAFVGRFAPLPPDLVGAARAAGDRVVAEPFDVAFSHAGSFPGRERHPYVLRDGELAALRALNAQLVAALVATRAIAADAGYEPHLTLLRDRKLVALEAIAAPRWRADAFALVRSGGGEDGYRIVQRWPLSPKA